MLTAALMPGALMAQGFDPPSSQALPNTDSVTLLPPVADDPAPAVSGTHYPISAEPAPAESVPAGISQSCPGGMTLSDLETMALAQNPSLARASAMVQAAKGEWLQVGLMPNPIGGYSTMEIGEEGTAGQEGGMISQEIVMGRKLKLNRAVAAQQIRRAEQDYQAQQWRVMNDVQIQFYEVLVAQRKVELAERLVGIGEQGVTASEQLFKAKEVGSADVLQARIEANTARIIAQNAHNAHLAAWRTLAAVIGSPEMQPVALSGDPRAGLADIQWADAYQHIMSASPELAAAQAGVDKARNALKRARAEPIPNIDLQFTAQHDNATTSDIAGVQAVIPVPIWNRNQGGIAKADAELSAAQADVARLQLALQQRLAVAFERYSNARQQVERYESEILKDAQSSLDLVNSAYKQGEFGYLLLLTAQRTYFQTNLAYLDSLRQLRTSAVEIDGLLLTGSLQNDK